MSQTVDELISQVNKLGLRLNNLFQLHTGRWQANITDGERFWEFGRGDTPVEALQAALHLQSTTEPELGRKQVTLVHNPIRRRAVTDTEAAEELKGLV